MANKGKTSDAALAEQLIVGTGKHFASAASLAFASATFTPTQVTSQLQKLVTLRSDVDGAKATVKAKLAAEAVDMPLLRDFMVAFVAFVKATFSNSPDVLADFGLDPKKARTPLTVQQKAAATAKSEATRKARGTMGPKKKLSVKGNVTGVVVTPVTSGPAATASEPIQLASNTSSAPIPGASK